MERIPLLVKGMSVNASSEPRRGLLNAMEPTGEDGDLEGSKDLAAASYKSMESDSLRQRTTSLSGSLADEFYHIEDQVHVSVWCVYDETGQREFPGSERRLVIV